MDPRHLPGQRLAGTRSPRRSGRRGPSCRGYPEVEAVVSQIGRPDDGTDPTGFYNVEFFVPLRAAEGLAGRAAADRLAPRSSGSKRPRTKPELIQEMNAELSAQAARRRLELLAEHPRQRHGGPVRRQGRQLGQDLRPRPGRAGGAGRAGARTSWPRSSGIENVGIFRIKGQIEPGVPRRPGEVQELGRATWPTSTTSSRRPWAARRSRR